MARYRKRDAVEMRLADELVAGGRRFSASLSAKRATGVEGYRMTLAFVELDGDDGVFVDLEPAPSRDAAAARGRSLAEEPERLRSLLEGKLSAPDSDA